MPATGNDVRSYNVTVTDLVHMYGVHRNTVYDWVATTDIPHRRLPKGDLRFNAEEVDEWMKRRTTEEA